MMQIYFSYDLSEADLRESCEFTDEDIDIGNQSQIDFIIVADTCEELPNYLAIHLKGMYTKHNKTFRDILKTIHTQYL